MTPDIPKGPESENARHLWSAIDWTLWGHGLNDVAREPIATAMVNAVSAEDIDRIVPVMLAWRERRGWPALHEEYAKLRDELERLTAEAGRLQVELGMIRGELADFAQESMPSHVSTLQAVRWLIAEHDEQVKHNEEVGSENGALCDERDQLQAEVSRLREQLAAQPTIPLDAEGQMTVTLLDAQGSVNMAVVEAVLNRVRSWGVSSSEVEAPRPPKPRKNDGLWQQIWDALDSKNPGDVCESLLDDYTDLACAAVQGWLGEQEEHAREARQHKVFVRPAEKDWWKATCPKCDIVQYSPSKQQAEDWKDQHEADTLRPVGLTPEQAADELCRETRELFEGRPSGSERLAPRPVETFDCKQDCPAVAPECFCVGAEPHRLCCHEDAAQAARSEATPKDGGAK